MEEPAAAVDETSPGLPLEICAVPSEGQQKQLVKFDAAAAEASSSCSVNDGDPMRHEMVIIEETVNKFEANMRRMKMKMHKYPPSIRALDKDGLYTIPRVVAIGPYHHYDGEHLKQGEEVKRAAAWHCMKKSGLEFRELYQAVVSVVVEIDAHGLYDKDARWAGISNDEFIRMMFYDACFLVMYMLKKSGLACERMLSDFFDSTQESIAHDIMLLENQIPWPVVEAVMDKLKYFTLEKKEVFIARWKDVCLQDRVSVGVYELTPRVVWDEDYQPPHLLGLLRFYMVGEITGRSSDFKVSDSDLEKIKTIKISAGAIELAEMGIHLTATELPDMGLAKKWIIWAKLSIAPLSLNNLRASQLVNMAALELCITPDFFDDEAEIEDSAVCSYLLLLRMLMHREADVHELRRKGILQGAGLSDKQTLDLFTSLHSLPQGRCHAYVMVEIAAYKMKRPIKVYAFIHEKKKTCGIFSTIVTIVTVFGTLVGILAKLKSLKRAA